MQQASKIMRIRQVIYIVLIAWRSTIDDSEIVSLHLSRETDSIALQLK